MAGKYPNATEIVDEFEISSATAHRDISYLRDRLLAPLTFDARKNGYTYQDQEFQLPFENNPRVIMILGLLNSLARESGLNNLKELNQLKKILENLVTEGSKKLEDLIYCEWIEAEAVDELIFSDILTALLTDCQLTVLYRSIQAKPATRTIEPLKLVNYQGRWYVLAWCLLRNSTRLFHLARIQRAKILPTHAKNKIPLDDHWMTEPFGIFKGPIQYTATIALFGTAAEIVKYQQWHPKQEIKTTQNGITLSLPVSDDRELLMKILQFGSQAQVIKPKQLRKKVLDEINKMSANYEDI